MVDMQEIPTKPNDIPLIYMYNENLAINNLQGLVCHKTKPTIDLIPLSGIQSEYLKAN